MKDNHSYQQLLERYYNGTSTLEEEKALKAYWASSTDLEDMPEKALAAYWAVGRKKRKAKVYKIAYYKRLKWVAAFILFFSCSWLGLNWWGANQGKCVAYVGGQKITDDQEVMMMMQNTMKEATQTHTMVTMEKQMRDMFALPS